MGNVLTVVIVSSAVKKTFISFYALKIAAEILCGFVSSCFSGNQQLWPDLYQFRANSIHRLSCLWHYCFSPGFCSYLCYCQHICSGLLKPSRSEEHTSELQSQSNLVCRLLLEK